MTVSDRLPADASPDRRPAALNAGTFGMILFLAALSVLFGWTIGGYVYLRSLQPAWPPPGSPPAPMAGLWLSTLLILLASASIHWALRSVRRHKAGALLAALVGTMVLGGLFLANQAHNWSSVASIAIPPESKGKVFAAVFYILTGTHALHVAGGLILLIVVTYKAWRGEYTSNWHPGVRYAAMYWHFLDVVWLIMFTALFLI